MPITENRTVTPTGATRFREQKRLFGRSKAVLQIEFTERGFQTEDFGFGPESRPVERIFWRDANMEEAHRYNIKTGRATPA